MTSDKNPGAGWENNSVPARSAQNPKQRGITHGYQSGDGLNGTVPSYHKEAGTLWQGWDKAMADKNHQGTRTFEQKRREGMERDQRIHQKPVSKLEVDRLKAERAKAKAQSHLIMKGPDGAYIRSATQSERECKIGVQEKALNRQKGRAQKGFERSSSGKTRFPIRGPTR